MLCGKVLARFEETNYKIVASKMMKLSSEILREHYAHIAQFPFYPEVEAFMQETPVIALVLEGEGIVDGMREMLGVTDCLQADKGTIREQWGSKDESDSKMRNIAHASDSLESAEVEIPRFFSEEEVHQY